MIHIVKGFSIVSEAEVDVFLELLCFVHDPTNVGSLLSGSSASLKPSLCFAVWQKVKVLAAQLYPTLCKPMDWMEPVGLLCPWDSPGENPGVGCQVSDLSNPGVKPASLVSSALTVRFFTTSAHSHIVNQLCFSFFLKDGSMAKDLWIFLT